MAKVPFTKIAHDDDKVSRIQGHVETALNKIGTQTQDDWPDGTLYRRVLGVNSANKLTADSYRPSLSVTSMLIDWSLSDLFYVTLSGNTTFTFPNKTDGQAIAVAVTNPSTYTVTWPTVKWKAGTVPTQTTSGIDVYTFLYIGGTVYGSCVQAMA